MDFGVRYSLFSLVMSPSDSECLSAWPIFLPMLCVQFYTTEEDLRIEMYGVY